MKWRKLFVLLVAVALAAVSFVMPLDAQTVYPGVPSVRAGEVSSIKYNAYYLQNANPVAIYVMVYDKDHVIWQGELFPKHGVGPINIIDGVHFTIWHQSRTTLEEHFTGFTSHAPYSGDHTKIRLLGYMYDIDKKGV